MLNVIDTATSQATLDFGVAYSEGFFDCYVKMGGDNVDTYVAPWYTRQVDRARAARFVHVGHYWVPDANPADADLIDTPTQQADYMVDRLHDWRRATDFIVLDNEALDGAWMFTDGGAAEFIERVKLRLNIPGRQVVMYGGWYDLAAHAWPAVLATGAVFIVADYRASSPPMGFPDIPTVPRARIIGHQYGGRDIGGVITDVNVFVDDAFQYGGNMEDQMRQYVAANQRPYDAPTWDQMCGSLIFRFNSWRGWVSPPSRDISSAYRAGMNSGWLNTDLTRAPVGAFHFFDIAGAANGHVMQDARGGGLVCLSSGYALSESLGYAIGFQSVPGYIAAKGARYMGWATNYGGGTISVSGTAGDGYAPIGDDEEMLSTEAQAWLDRKLKESAQAVIEQVLGYGTGGTGTGPKSATLGDQANKIRADIAYIHTTSPDSLKNIRAAITTGGVDVDALAAKVAALVKIPAGSGLTEAQVEAAVRRVFSDAGAA